METPKDPRLFDIISDMEGASIRLDESITTLYLFSDLLSDAARFLDPTQPYTVQVFDNRLDVLSSMLSMILRELSNANQELRSHITAGYSLHSRTKQQEAK